MDATTDTEFLSEGVHEEDSVPVSGDCSSTAPSIIFSEGIREGTSPSQVATDITTNNDDVDFFDFATPSASTTTSTSEPLDSNNLRSVEPPAPVSSPSLADAANRTTATRLSTGKVDLLGFSEPQSQSTLPSSSPQPPQQTVVVVESSNVERLPPASSRNDTILKDDEKAGELVSMPSLLDGIFELSSPNVENHAATAVLQRLLTPVTSTAIEVLSESPGVELDVTSNSMTSNPDLAGTVQRATPLNDTIATDLETTDLSVSSPTHQSEPGQSIDKEVKESEEKSSREDGKIEPTEAEFPTSAIAASQATDDTDTSTPSSQDTTTAMQQRIQQLEAELAEAWAISSKHERHVEESSQLLVELQESLQQFMSAKAEAENTTRLLEIKVKQLEEVNTKQSDELANLADLQSVLQEHMEAKAEAEVKTRTTSDRVTELEQIIQQQAQEIESLQQQWSQAQSEKQSQAVVLDQIRSERDEQHRKEKALTSRLNAAKKEQAEQTNLAERYEDEIKALEQELESTKHELSETQQAKVLLENELEVLKKTSENRIRRAEAALLDEQALNEERKRKMKAFVEHKSEELRQAKSDHESLQVELAQTNKSLLDLNQRWKQLHAQWVQSQTRNRELQRDLNRIKKDSENLHKVGDTLEMKLSRSATETEEHKNKRLAAKHELMTVLRTLEAERELTGKLRDSVKFTFTPKALSQQQLLQEGLHDFEAQLSKLATRLGKTLPPIPDADHSNNSDLGDHSESDGFDLVNGGGGVGDDAALNQSRTDAEIQRLIAKLEYETQRVSQGIMALSSNI